MYFDNMEEKGMRQRIKTDTILRHS